ncbi:hypothetical protein AMAG_11028 [Allomyces macrogynus ATCC 38327]|uniref:Uncharacterized protein n=1 Tax=Allomyces macrogynus (strain ATCC 38327) TaxID=578462 RepID=A0A0L0SSN5_ALLM3|nr:hypothetical protein AMAG_11028 [Allomyces macrogynus ATCC 38327]|eukprot:KNE65395.1 hypothetical protein AMAG_11028 [Allomyces macrogynus ATCC 38327]
MDPFQHFQHLIDQAVLAHAGAANLPPGSLPPLPPIPNLPLEFAHALINLRTAHREAYQGAVHARAHNAGARNMAMNARRARLNRDWSINHVQSAVTSYERADLDFDPPDLITIDEMAATPAEAEALANLSPHDLMAKRFNQERMARMRTHARVTQMQNVKKTAQAELLAALNKEDALDRDVMTWANQIDELAKRYGLDLSDPTPPADSEGDDDGEPKHDDDEPMDDSDARMTDEASARASAASTPEPGSSRPSSRSESRGRGATVGENAAMEVDS